MSVYVIPRAGTALLHDDSVERVLGVILIDDDSAILHAEDGRCVVLASDPAGVAFIKAQAGLEG